jgi:hypothetical protein
MKNGFHQHESRLTSCGKTAASTFCANLTGKLAIQGMDWFCSGDLLTHLHFFAKIDIIT